MSGSDGRERIRIFDTTLRDGEQSPGCSMNLHEKLSLARQLAKLGVDVIEAGFPIASEGDLESVKAISRARPTNVDGGKLRDMLRVGADGVDPS